MGERLQVSSKVLTWAIDRAGYTLDSLSNDFPGLADWVDDIDGPTFPQLEKLSKRLSVPTAIFFSPTVPKIPDPMQSFRTLPSYMRQRLSSDLVKKIFGAQSHQISLNEIYFQENSSLNVNLLKSIDLATGAKSSAKKARLSLGVTAQDQINWNGGPAEALKKWREIVTDNGIFVFSDAFNSGEVSGFCLYDEKFPVIVTNNSHSHSRQCFTIFHELGHIGLGTGGVDAPFIDEEIINGGTHEIETFCDAFAAEFIAPSEVVVTLLSDMVNVEAAITNAAERLKVSRLVILRTAYQAKKLNSADYNRLLPLFLNHVRTHQGTKGGSYYNNVKTYLGSKYLRRVFDLYSSNRIEEDDAARYLRVAPKNLEGLRPSMLET